MTPLEKLASYLDTPEALASRTVATRPDFDWEGRHYPEVELTRDDLRAVLDLARQASVPETNPVDGEACCGHHLVEHTEEGCVHGWRWAGKPGLSEFEGCRCDMQGPTKLKDVPAAGIETMATAVVEVEADDEEAALDEALSNAPRICAVCSGWGRDHNLEIGEWEPTDDDWPKMEGYPSVEPADA